MTKIENVSSQVNPSFIQAIKLLELKVMPIKKINITSLRNEKENFMHQLKYSIIPQMVLDLSLSQINKVK